jgi:N-methylhydantoinase B
VRLDLPGGGGMGSPWERDPAAVHEDVRNGYVSVSAARFTYGVAMAADGEIDVAETARLRSEAGRASA